MNHVVSRPEDPPRPLMEVGWTSFAYWYAAAQVVIVLLPLAALVMNGPSDSLAMLGGGTAALVFLSLIKAQPDYRFLLTVAGCILFYALLALLRLEDVDTYFPHYAVLSVYYGFPAGLLMRRLSRSGRGNGVVAGWGIVSLLLAVAAYEAMNAVGLENIVSYSGRYGFVRQNIAGDQAYYWRFFHISNLIVGVIPYTIFAMCALPLILVRGRPIVKTLFALAGGLSIYVNALVVTRTTFAAALFSTLVVMFFLVRSARVSLRPRPMVIIGGLFLVPISAVFLYDRYATELSQLAVRFASTMDDGRLIIWLESVDLIVSHPFGGGIRLLTSANWGHNLFVDVGLVTGVPGLIAIIIAVVAIYRRLCDFLVGQGPENITDVYFTAVLIGSLAVSMLMPPQVSLMCVLLMGAGYLGERSVASLTAAWRDNEPAQLRKPRRGTRS